VRELVDERDGAAVRLDRVGRLSSDGRTNPMNSGAIATVARTGSTLDER
jgi:hypothetical protein